jgi:peptidylprolyl isomerase
VPRAHAAHVALAALVSTALLLGACGGDDSPTTKTPDTTPLTACQPGQLDGISVTGPFGQAPTVKLDGEVSVEHSKCAVVKEGSGARAQEGDLVDFDYVLVNGRTGATFAQSYGKGVKATMPLNGTPIRGLRQALTGAQVGSRVVVAVSPEDGFGLQGADPENGLEADDSLVLVTDIAGIRHILQRAEGTPVAPVAGLPTVTLASNGRPTITVPKTAPPTQLVVQPLIEGTGATIQKGQTITAHYTGVIWGTGKQFDSSWTNGAPIDLPLVLASEAPDGAGAIAGWVTGLAGQKVGSQILLVIPPAEGYGAAGQPQAGISGTDTLVFVVDLLAVR